MDYEKKYNEALEKAEGIIKYYKERNRNEAAIEDLQEIFPELKESKEEWIEKLRKEIITFLGNKKVSSINESDAINVWLAWLEKQGNQTVFNTPSRETILAIWELGNDWKELTKGVISTEHGTQLDYIQKHWSESEYYLREKQGEQKPTDKIEPKFKHGDRVRNKKSGLEQTLGSCIEDIYEGAFPFRIKDQDDWELVEHDTAWSEEDEELFTKTLYFLDAGFNNFKVTEGIAECKSWVQSLKQRCTWKPSDKQIRALRWVLNNIPYNTHKEEISGLLEQITKHLIWKHQRRFT